MPFVIAKGRHSLLRLGPSDGGRTSPGCSAETATSITWPVVEVAEDQIVIERTFRAFADGREIPGTLWLPDATSGAVPLVLIGHGGSQHKTSDGPRELANLLVRDHGFAAAAIDGPVHGERRSDHGADPSAVFADHRADIEQPGSLATMAVDWQAALDLLHDMDGWDKGPVGYWGLSMGTLYGLPFLAQDNRVRVAVLGLWGSTGTTPATWSQLASAASQVCCPLLFLAQLEDQLFAPTGVLELFTALASRDKRMHLNTGLHGQVPAEEQAGALAFLVDRLHQELQETA